jgi:CubicO group peptidase (beta-lactamase class C family)
MTNAQNIEALGLQQTTPEALGIPSDAVAGFIRALERRPYRLHAFLLVRNGKLCFASAAAPYALDTPHRVYSAGKSVLMLSALFAMQEEKLRPDDRVADFFRDLLQGDTRFDSLTVSDLLTMRSGQTDDPFPAILKDLDADLIRLFFQAPPMEAPGQTFRYNNTIPHIVYALTERATGELFEQYQNRHLCEPLQARIFAPTNPKGQYNPVVMAMSAATLMKFALFFLQEGCWNGQTLLDAELIREAVATHTQTGMAGNAAEYGWQIWRNTFGGYRMDGGWGQYAIILPEQNLAAVLLSDMPDSAFALKAFEDEIFSRLCAEPLAENAEAYAELCALQAGMTLAPKGGQPQSNRQGEWFGKRYLFANPGMSLRFAAENDMLRLSLTTDRQTEDFRCGLGGAWRLNARHFLVKPERNVDNGVYCLSENECYLTGVWRGENVFEMAGKSLGATGEYLYRLSFTPDGLTLSCPLRACRGGPHLQETINLIAEGSGFTDEHRPS